MTQDAGHGRRNASFLDPWRARLVDRLPVLATAAAVLLVFLGLQRLSLTEVLVGLGATVLAALLFPASAGPAGSLAAGAAAGEPVQDVTVRFFADALPDPCIILDHRSLVLHRNPLAAQHFPGVTVGDPLAFALRFPALLAAVDTVRRTGGPLTIELHQTVPTETWHKVSIAPFGANGDGPPARLVVTLQSLTEEKRLGAMRTDFIANASHELRTPLTSLLGFIDTLLGPASKDAAAREKFLGIMRVQAVRMSKLIDDLLSLSRIEMRQHMRPTATLDIAILLREVKEGLQTQAEEAGVTLDLALPAEPIVVTGDRDELYEVFENLFDNALKYGAGGAKVDVALAPVANRPGYHFAVTVTDYGAGIEAEHVPRLTERFYRVDAESSRKKKGTGLGLAIVKHILTRHRGALSIKSQPGQGTRVEVLLAR
jgi:two-component system phosphate regulon sensor histidine kinase PhoR